MYSKGKYILFQTVLMIASPISSLFVSLRFYKNTISQIFFIIFAYYFGYYCGFVNDLMHHFVDMRNLYVGQSLKEVLGDERIYLLGSDLYHIAFKFILSRFTTSTQVFGGCACAVYAALFVFFIRQFKEFYKGSLSVPCTMLFVCTAVVIEYYRYQGLRFATGAFYFLAFYMKYVKTRNWRYLLLGSLCPLFHFSLITLPACAGVNWLLNRASIWTRLALLATSVFVRMQNVDFVPLLLKVVPIKYQIYLGIDVTDSRIRTSVLNHMADMRAYGNIFYRYRSSFLLLCGGAILFLFWRNKVPFDKRYRVLFYMFLTLYTVVNFCYGDLTFFDRFFQITLVLFYSYLFVVSVKYYDRLKHVNFLFMCMALIPMAYALLSPLIEEREYLFHCELLFGNFFVDWDGNALNFPYEWRFYKGN